MADTVVVANSGNNLGANFAVDDAGASGIWPYAKLAFGASGTQTEVSAANPLPVGGVVGATPVPVDLKTIVGFTPAIGSGVVTPGTFRVVIATDQPTFTNAMPVTVSSGNVNSNTNGNAVVTNTGTFAVQNNSTGKTLKTASNSLTANANVVALVSSKRIKVYALTCVSVGANATLIQFMSNGANGNELWRTLLQGNTNAPMGYAQSVTPPGMLFGTTAGEPLTMRVNQTDTIHYSIGYFDDDAT